MPEYYYMHALTFKELFNDLLDFNCIIIGLFRKIYEKHKEMDILEQINSVYGELDDNIKK